MHRDGIDDPRGAASRGPRSASAGGGDTRAGRWRRTRISDGNGARSRHNLTRGVSGIDVNGSRTDLPEHAVAFLGHRQQLEPTHQLPQLTESISTAHPLLTILEGG